MNAIHTKAIVRFRGNFKKVVRYPIHVNKTANTSKAAEKTLRETLKQAVNCDLTVSEMKIKYPRFFEKLVYDLYCFISLVCLTTSRNHRLTQWMRSERGDFAGEITMRVLGKLDQILLESERSIAYIQKISNSYIIDQVRKWASQNLLPKDKNEAESDFANNRFEYTNDLAEISANSDCEMEIMGVEDRKYICEAINEKLNPIEALMLLSKAIMKAEPRDISKLLINNNFQEIFKAVITTTCERCGISIETFSTLLARTEMTYYDYTAYDEKYLADRLSRHHLYDARQKMKKVLSTDYAPSKSYTL